MNDGQSVPVNSFELEENRTWTWTRASRQVEGASTLRDAADKTTEGNHSFGITYQVTGWNRVAQPTLEYGTLTPPPIPVIISPAFATRYGLRTQAKKPLQVGDPVSVSVDFIEGTTSRTVDLLGEVQGIIQEFPTVDEDIPYLIAERSLLQTHLNAHTTLNDYYDVNQIWLDTGFSEPDPAFRSALSNTPGVVSADFAWDRVQVIKREPLQNAVTGLFFAGFWISTGLILLDFGFYLALTIRRRALSFAVLRSMGWSRQHIWRLLAAELIAFIAPALLVGVALGVMIAYLILPFMAFVGGSTLQIPGGNVVLLLVLLVSLFMTLLAVLIDRLQQDSISEMIRLVE
jgi:hypothetical protein